MRKLVESAGTKTLLGVMALLLPLTGACTGGVQHGTVIRKDHRPARAETVPKTKQVCTGVGAKRSCRKVADGSEVRRHPECYQLKLRDSDGKTGIVCVSVREFRKTKVGDQR